MDLGVLLESSQGSQSSSRVGSCTCPFLPSCTSSVTLPFARIKGSVAFPRGFPTRLSHDAFPQGCPTCHRGVSRSSAGKSRQCRKNRFPWNGLRHLGDSGTGGTTLEFLSSFLWRVPPLEMRRERREFFPDHTGKDPSSRARRPKRGSSGCWRDSHASSRVDTGMSGNFLSCSKGVKDPLKIPEVRWDSPETHHRKWSSSRQEERTSWIFSS